MHCGRFVGGRGWYDGAEPAALAEARTRLAGAGHQVGTTESDEYGESSLCSCC